MMLSAGLHRTRRRSLLKSMQPSQCEQKIKLQSTLLLPSLRRQVHAESTRHIAMQQDAWDSWHTQEAADAAVNTA